MHCITFIFPLIFYYNAILSRYYLAKHFKFIWETMWDDPEIDPKLQRMP